MYYDNATDSDENMEIVEETEKLAEESLFIDLKAYKGQDDRQAKSLGTPGLFTPSHYVLALSDYYPFFTPTANAESWAVEAFSLCVLLLPNLREVPHGTKGTGPRFITRPVYLRSEFRNNMNTVLI